MTFNIRYGTANDGENRWTNRRDMLFALLRTENPDLIGLQEALRFQIDEILAAVPGYAVVGVGRDDGKAAGEMSAILFRTGALPRGRERHVLVLGHAGDPRLEDVGQPHHAHLVVGPLRRSRRHRLHPLQPAPRSRVAAVAREEHGAAAAAHHGAAHPLRAGHRHRRLQRRRVEPRAARAGRPGGSGGGAGRGRRRRRSSTPSARCIATRRRSARSPASPSGRRRATRSTTCWCSRARPSSTPAIVRTSDGRRYPSDHFPVTARIRLATSTGGR